MPVKNTENGRKKMPASTGENNPPPKQPSHINTTVVVTFFCGACKKKIGDPEIFELNAYGDDGEITGESINCPICKEPIAHKRIVITEMP